MEPEAEQQLIGLAASSDSNSGPMVSATVGRVMNTLLESKPKKLQDAISQLHTPPKIAPVTVSLEQSLWFLHKYVGEAAEKGEHLDQVLIPIVQHSLTTRKSKQGNQALILLNWLFQDDILFQAVMKNLASIISRRDDRYVALGWCILGRSLVEYDTAEKNGTNAIKEKYDVILKIFCSCITHLLSIICNGSNMQEGFELPTRLAVAAADFILSLSVALTRTELESNNITKKQKSSLVNAKTQLPLLPTATNDGDENSLRKACELSSSLKMKLLLWNNLNGLTTLVKKLIAWSRKSRSLHAKGLERVFNWLEEIKHYGSFQDQTESQMLKTGSLLLSSCWKHYGMLLHLEDHKFSQQHKELLEQYLSGIQFYAENEDEEPNTSNNSKSETINFFLNCLLLLLGRLNNQQFGNAITEFGSQISQVLMSRLRCADEEVIDGAINIFKAVIFRTNHTLSKRSLDGVTQMDALLPVLLNLLDERDAAAKAIVKLLAEYCSICSDTKCLNEVLKRIGSKNVAQRRNAVDVVADLFHISSGSVDALSQVAWQDVSNRLLECLGDEDQIIQNQAAKLIPMIDPPLVLPTLVEQSYSKHKNVQILASGALLALLINQKQKPEILCMLLDCLSNLSQNSDSGDSTSGKNGAKFDADTILKLLSEWATHVEDWRVIVGPLIDKMLAEPSNAVIVRFLSHISEYLAESVDLVFNRLISHMRERKETDECFSERTDSNSEDMKQEHCLFNRLCPLLIIRLLPFRVFDDLNSPLVYGQNPSNLETQVPSEDRRFLIEGTECIAALIIKRALSKTEFEDVRKLAAELCGRIHPKVLVPILSPQFESAAKAKDVLKIKVCLFSFCTSLMVRGSKVHSHPDVLIIRKTIQKVLAWKSFEGDEIPKAQHGCIDCLALMVGIELQASESSKGTSIPRDSVLAYVINQLTDNGDNICFESDGSDSMDESTHRLSFRLCMANVLISTCQKISDSGKKSFVRKVLPHIIRSVGGEMEPEIRAACIQVLFSMAFHLKSSIFPYSNDLLNVALKSLRERSEKEKLAGAKLLASLMAGEEEVVESISTGLLEARILLQNLSSSDPSPDVRQTSQQLLVCLTPH